MFCALVPGSVRGLAWSSDDHSYRKSLGSLSSPQGITILPNILVTYAGSFTDNKGHTGAGMYQPYRRLRESGLRA